MNKKVDFADSFRSFLYSRSMSLSFSFLTMLTI